MNTLIAFLLFIPSSFAITAKEAEKIQFASFANSESGAYKDAVEEINSKIKAYARKGESTVMISFKTHICCNQLETLQKRYEKLGFKVKAEWVAPPEGNYSYEPMMFLGW